MLKLNKTRGVIKGVLQKQEVIKKIALSGKGLIGTGH